VITVLPPLFAALATTALFAALYALWRSVRAVLSPDVAFEAADAGVVSRRNELLARKEQLVADLHDLELEHAGGKLDDADFHAMQAKLRGEAKRVLRALDDDAAPFRTKAEELIAAKLGAKAPKAEKAEKKPEAEKKPADALTCPACSAPNDVDAVFCKKCGTSLAKDAPDA
jgi:ribosomal protein L40E